MDQFRGVDSLASGWLAVLLLLAVGGLAWVNLVSPRQWVVLARSFGALRLGRHRLREDLDVRDRTLTGLAVMSAVVIAIFAYQVLLYHGWVRPGMPSYLYVLAAVVGVVGARLLLLQLIRLLPAGDGGLKEYLYTVIVFHVVLGLLLLPVAVLMSWPGQVSWRKWLAWSGLGIGVAVLLFGWVRAVVVGVGSGAPLRYIFLYLCALEMLPVALALQYARNIVPSLPHP